MFISTDEDANKILCMAQVPKDIVSSKGFKADEWCKQVQGLIGGKGGGKPENAQASGNKPQALQEAMKVAIAFAESKLGAKMPDLGSAKSEASNASAAPSDYVVVEKAQADLKDGPILKSTIGNIDNLKLSD